MESTGISENGRPIYPLGKTEPVVPVVSIMKRREFVEQINAFTDNLEDTCKQLEYQILDLREYIAEMKSIRRSLDALVDKVNDHGT